jgi:hypothetical protein
MFETGSYFASRAEHIDSMMAAAWMPLAWLAVWHLREKLRAIGWRCWRPRSACRSGADFRKRLWRYSVPR